MSEYIQSTHEDTTYVTEKKVFCDGPKFSKHPRVYLTVDGGERDEVVCPYCGHTFKKKEKPEV